MLEFMMRDLHWLWFGAYYADGVSCEQGLGQPLDPGIEVSGGTMRGFSSEQGLGQPLDPDSKVVEEVAVSVASEQGLGQPLDPGIEVSGGSMRGISSEQGLGQPLDPDSKIVEAVAVSVPSEQGLGQPLDPGSKVGGSNDGHTLSWTADGDGSLLEMEDGRNMAFQEVDVEVFGGMSVILDHARRLIRNVRENVITWPPVAELSADEGRTFLLDRCSSTTLTFVQETFSEVD
jgi:hypothetical protein